MKLLFKQRMFSWFDSYDIYYEAGNTAFTVEGKLSWGHELHILDPAGSHIGTVKQVLLTWMPKFELYLGERCIGHIKREMTFFSPKYTIECNGWSIAGDWLEWDYTICGPGGQPVASISKELWNFTDTYTIDVVNPADALMALMVVLAIDAEKCSRK